MAGFNECRCSFLQRLAMHQPNNQNLPVKPELIDKYLIYDGQNLQNDP